jgi:hypothetical protein
LNGHNTSLYLQLLNPTVHSRQSRLGYRRGSVACRQYLVALTVCDCASHKHTRPKPHGNHSRLAAYPALAIDMERASKQPGGCDHDRASSTINSNAVETMINKVSRCICKRPRIFQKVVVNSNAVETMMNKVSRCITDDHNGRESSRKKSSNINNT